MLQKTIAFIEVITSTYLDWTGSHAYSQISLYILYI